jgi:NAD(P)-dependent dehydrogenase (short-subunit alcohol dehydrogenase family)
MSLSRERHVELSEVLLQAAFVEAAKLLPSGLEYLICNAGIVTSYCKASEDSLDAIQETMKTNVLGAIATIQGALPLLRQGTKKTVRALSYMTKRIIRLFCWF